MAVLEEDAEYSKRRVDVYSCFEPKLYIKFREQTILKSAIEFAREGRIGAVSSLIARYPAEMNPVRSFGLNLTQSSESLSLSLSLFFLAMFSPNKITALPEIHFKYQSCNLSILILIKKKIVIGLFQIPLSMW